ncbi:hypothetical protein CJJ07_000621 [Candidozyma auris]|nr:hypothetical protein CJJ07_000621 [[Candida] auris]QEL60630.1 hypothetical protein CJJ09_002744 [[Candida] auris]
MDRTSANTFDSFSFNPLSSGSFATSSGGYAGGTSSGGYTGSHTEETDPNFYPSTIDDQGFGGKSRQTSINASTVSGSSIQASPAWTSPQSVSDIFDTAHKISKGSFGGNSGQQSTLMSPLIPNPKQFQNIYPVQRSLSITGLHGSESFDNGTAFSSVPRQRADSFGIQHTRNKSLSVENVDSFKKKDSRMKYTSQSFTPNFDAREASESFLPTSVAMNPSSDKHESTNAESSSFEKVQALKAELAFQTELNKSVTERLKQFKLNKGQASTGSYKDASSITMPRKFHQLFKDLTKTLNERTADLEDTKSRLEAIIVALVMNKGSDITENGTFDAQEMAHRLTTKLAVLSAENEALRRMVSYSNKQTLLVEVRMLREENAMLKRSMERSQQQGKNS